MTSCLTLQGYQRSPPGLSFASRSGRPDSVVGPRVLCRDCAWCDATSTSGGIDESLSDRHLTSAARLRVAVACAGLLLLATPGAAQATAPDQVPATPSTFTFAAGQVCSFPLKYAEGPNKAVLRTFSNGRLTITGSYKVTLTNLDTGAKLGVNASGPLFFAANGDLREAGPQLFVLFPFDVYGPGIYVYTGRTIPTRGPDGAIVSIVNNGKRSSNLCDFLT